MNCASSFYLGNVRLRFVICGHSIINDEEKDERNGISIKDIFQ